MMPKKNDFEPDPEKLKMAFGRDVWKSEWNVAEHAVIPNPKEMLKEAESKDFDQVQTLLPRDITEAMAEDLGHLFSEEQNYEEWHRDNVSDPVPQRELTPEPGRVDNNS